MSLLFRSAAAKIAATADISTPALPASRDPNKPVEDPARPTEDDDDLDDTLDKITARDLKWFHPSTSVNGSEVNESVMVDGLKEVEDQMKERELNTITISSISVSKLPLVSNFTKNEPWLKVTYGQNHNWNSMVSLVTDERGTSAEWEDLNYEFILPKEESERMDLTIAICSQKIVLGKYVLQAKNFNKIPKAEVSEFFEVKGKISNSLGKAGRLVMICRHGRAEIKKESKLQKDSSEANIVYAPKKNIVLNYDDIDKVYVKVLSIVLADMSPVRSHETNSPLVTVSCGSWEKKTNIDYGAGSSSKWTKLYWKVIIGQFDILSFAVSSHTSGNDAIGTIGVAIDDLLPDKVGTDGVVIIVRYFTDGKSITGKIRVRLQIRYPTAIATILNNAASHAADVQRRNSQLRAESNPASRRPSVEPSQMKPTDRVVVTSFPFKLTITSITAVDLKPRHTLFANSPYVNAVYGSWGQGTEVTSGAGACANWSNLNWAVNVNEEHHLELNAWSRGLVIGGISLSPKFLLSQPIDKFGRATLLLKLTDENQVTSGKLKVACVYSPDVSEFALDSEAQKQKAIDEMVRLGLYFTSHCQSIELPATAKVIKVSVIDLVSVHFTKPNSPRVKLACDRQVAATTIAVRGGAHAQWVGMEWKFDIHKGSFLILAVTSDEKLIGTLELSARAIVSIPTNNKNVLEITCPITSTSGSITGRIKLSLKLSALASQSAPVVPGRVAVSPNADPKHFFESGNRTSLASLIQNKLILVVDIEKIQLHNVHVRSNLLQSIHNHKALWISLSYGKYHEATTEMNIPLSGQKNPMVWEALHWNFKVKEDYSLRMLLHSAEGILLGSLSISPQTLFSNQNEGESPDSLITLTETFFDENNAVAKVSLSYKKIVLKDWSNDFKAIEHGSNGYKAANHAAMMGTLASTRKMLSANGLLPPIFEGNGLGSIEEEEDDGEGGLIEDDEDMEFPMVANMNSIVVSDFNYHLIHGLLHHSKKPPLAQPSMNDWFTRNIFGIASNPQSKEHRHEPIPDHLPQDTRLCVRVEIHGDHNSNAGTRGSRWSYETSKVACDEQGKVVRIEDDVKIPLLTMHSELNITVFITFSADTSSGSLTHVLGTTVIVAEDFADVPRDQMNLTDLSRSISKGGASSARIALNCRLRPTSLQTIYQQHFQSGQTSSRRIHLPVIPPPLPNKQTKPQPEQQSAPESDANDDHVELPSHPATAWAPDTSQSLVPVRSTSITNILSQSMSPTSLVSPSGRRGMIHGKPYQFDIATDENAIGQLFSKRSPVNKKSPRASDMTTKPVSHPSNPKPTEQADHSRVSQTEGSKSQSPDRIRSLVQRTGIKSKTIATRNLIEDGIKDEETLDSPSGLVSVTAFKDTTQDINYAEEARRRRYSELISGVKLLGHDNEVEDLDQPSDDDDDDSTSSDKMTDLKQQSTNQRSRAPSILLKPGQMNDEVFFEKIKLTGYNIIIKNIMLIDLISAHRFKTNSPAIAVTCGADIFTTKILDDAGATGSWHNLNFTGIIHRDNDITFTVSSRGVIFAAITFTLKQLLRAASGGKITDTTASGSTPFKRRSSVDHHSHDAEVAHEVKFDQNDESDLVTIFGDLIPEDKTIKRDAGKIKVSFKLARL